VCNFYEIVDGFRVIGNKNLGLFGDEISGVLLIN